MRDCSIRQDDCAEVAKCPFQLERLTRELAKREERLLDFWNHAHDLLCVIGKDGTFRSVSPSSRTLLGYAPEEMEGTSLLVFLHPDDMEVGARLLREGQGHGLRVRFRHGEGHYVELDWSVGSPSCGAIHATARVSRALVLSLPQEVQAPKVTRAS